MEEFVLSLLLKMSAMEGIQPVPSQVPSTWSTTNAWADGSLGLVYEASSSEIIKECRSNPDGYIKFPVILYGAQQILLDDTKRIQFGDPSMDTPNYVVSAPVLECHSLLNVNKLTWRAIAYSRYFARVPFLPEFTTQKPLTKLFGETFYVGGAIGLLVLAVFAFSILWRKESNRLMVALVSGIAGMAVYEISLIGPAFEIPLSMLNTHRIGDIGCILGSFCIVYCFALENLIPKRLFQTHTVFVLTSLPFFIVASRGDTIQFGTTLPFTTLLIAFAWAAFRLALELKSSRSLESLFMFMYSAIFFLAVASDIFVFTGSSSGYTYVSLGILLAFLTLLLSVNQRISATYRERDYLRGNLEKEVARKTHELKTAMDNLQKTQAELVHSAKLASLGTLSAGIAHEINNSINFVSGAVAPLEKLIGKLEAVSPKDHELGKKLLAAIRDGITITVEIVKSLRNFTGLNQAKLKDVQLQEVVKSVLTILHAKLKLKYKVHVDVPEDMIVYGDVVGINQILMNLITNAIDAMPEGGSIEIRATQDPDKTILSVKDSGSGIPKAIQDRIFDPFFTTKDVGSGSGLGLYIISQEMKKHRGEIHLSSTEGQGTTFHLEFPKSVSAQGAA